MTHPDATPPSEGTEYTPAAADLAAQARAEFTSRATEQLAILTRFAMNLARLAHDTADRQVASPTGPDRLPPLMRAFDRMSRTIRQTIALEGRLHAGLSLKPSATRHPAARRQLVRGVEDAIQNHAKPECRENLLRDLYERLDDPELDAALEQDLAFRPIRDVIADIRNDFGIGADRSFPARPRSPADLRILHRRAAVHPPPDG